MNRNPVSEYMVTVRHVDLARGPIVTVGPFFTESRADYNARKASREFHSPDVLAVITVNPHRKGYPKAYRMGRVYRH